VVAKIYIPQPGKDHTIGSYEDEQGQLIRGVEVQDVVSQVEKLPMEGVTLLEVYIESPGGVVETGDQIYEYLEAQKKERNLKIKTIQTGPLASIATKLWAVGDEREADPTMPFLIHNPWNDPGPGDAKAQMENIERLMEEEAKLRKFYSQRFGITESALEPLMDNETELTGEELIALKFATSLKPIKVMALKKPEKKAKTLKERAAAMYKTIFGKDPEKAADETKSLDVPLTDGTVLVSDAADLAGLKGSSVTIEGQVPVDGDYQAADGSTVKVVGGKVADVVAAPAAKNEDMAAYEERISNLEAGVNTILQALEGMPQANAAAVTAALSTVKNDLNTEITNQITTLRAEIGTEHSPARAAAVYSNKVSKDKTEFRSISDVMALKAEERKNKKK